jgi:site-specific DNA-methyltransferase (adenine-specific)
MSNITLYQGDCIELMKNIPDKSVDLVLCDLPYGTTDCKWDSCIDLDSLWKEYSRILNDKGNILLFGDGSLFTASLMMSKKTWFKYNWFWKKNIKVGFLNAKKQPLRIFETVSCFGKPGQNNYYPIMVKGDPHIIGTGIRGGKTGLYSGEKKALNNKTTVDEYYPENILNFDALPPAKRFHESEKPVPLLEYLIKTYTTEGMTVLDNTMGSGSTGVACVNTNRDFVGIELDENYFNIAKTRIEEAKCQI